MEHQTLQQDRPVVIEARPRARAARIKWVVAALAGVLSVACSSGSPTATRVSSEGETSAVSMLVEESSSPESVEAENLSSSCLQVLDVTPTQVAPGDQIEIEVRCVFTNDPNRITVAFGAGVGVPEVVTADSIDGFLRRTIRATVPAGASDGPIQVRVGFFRSAISSVALDVTDSDPTPSSSFLVSANLDSNTLTLVTRTEPGGFNPPEDLTVGNGPRVVAVADVVGDSNVDIISLNASDVTITVLAGDGAGNFAQAGIFEVDPPGNELLTALAVGDVNGDGLPDVITANTDSNFLQPSTASVSVLLGTGAGFGSSTSFAVNPNAFAVAIGDVTGDDQPDIVVANDDDTDTVTVLEGDGSGGFPSTQVIGNGIVSRPRSVAVGDLNNDGIQDIVVGNTDDNTVSLFFADGTGGFTSEPATTGEDPRGLAIADVTGDGALDVVATSFDNNTVTILPGPTFTAGTSLNVGAAPGFVIVEDINRDDIPDIVTANFNDDTLSFLAGNGGGSFAPAESLPVGPGPFSVAGGSLASVGTP